VIRAAQFVFALMILWFSAACPRVQADGEHSYVIVTGQLQRAEERSAVQMGKSQSLLVVLPWQATGYTWTVSQHDKAFLDFKELDDNQYKELVEKGVLKNESHVMPGGIEKRVFEFHPLSIGTTKVELQYVRKFEKPPMPAKKFFVTVTISESQPDSH
jgi:predicted secreted protein